MSREMPVSSCDGFKRISSPCQILGSSKKLITGIHTTTNEPRQHYKFRGLIYIVQGSSYMFLEETFVVHCLQRELSQYHFRNDDLQNFSETRTVHIQVADSGWVVKYHLMERSRCENAENKKNRISIFTVNFSGIFLRFLFLYVCSSITGFYREILV